MPTDGDESSTAYAADTMDFLKKDLAAIIAATKTSKSAKKKAKKPLYRPGVEFVTEFPPITKLPPKEDDEGKCFGWNPNPRIDLIDIKSEPTIESTIESWENREDVYMNISDKPMSPQMTMQDMAVMSVDQSRAVITLKTVYNPFFLERLKSSIDPKYRNWNRDSKCWELHPSVMQQTQQICKEFYKGVQIIGQKPVLGTKFEKLLVKLSKDDKSSIYKILALKYHPDKGGDHETMSLINEVFKQS